MTLLDFKRVALAVFFLIALAWYCDTRPHFPAAASINGVYTNACCSSLTLRDGIIMAGAAHVPFDLEIMKFGLTAYPSQTLQVSGDRVEAYPDADPGPLLFDKSGTTITVCGDRLCNQEYAFKRQ